MDRSRRIVLKGAGATGAFAAALAAGLLKPGAAAAASSSPRWRSRLYSGRGCSVLHM